MSSDAAHPYHSINIPQDTPFRLQRSPGRGWGAFATQNISRGSTILKEEPLFVIRKPHELITESDVRSAFQHLNASKKRQFLCICDNAASSFTRMESAFAENSFAIRDCKTGQELVHGCFLLHSRINHSCIPNTKLPDTITGEEITSYATRDIAAGEELFFCYESDFMYKIRSDRHRLLRFECRCKACDFNTQFQRSSDMRRTLMRGLHYLIHGKDIDPLRYGPLAFIIVDPELKVAAETRKIPPSSLFVYGVMTMALAEQEGLMDAFLVKLWTPCLSAIQDMLTTNRDKDVSRLAMAQVTWTQALCVALRLWGQ